MNDICRYVTHNSEIENLAWHCAHQLRPRSECTRAELDDYNTNYYYCDIIYQFEESMNLARAERIGVRSPLENEFNLVYVV